jgi:uncharacterized membrane protein YeaQ/YmgE (transglycosylase-associated protein family)
MEVLWAILTWVVFGIICGALARLLVPGRQPMSLFMTMLLGIAGSFAGGFIGYLLIGGEPLQASGFLLSLLGAVVVLLASIYAGRSDTRTV